MREWSGGKGKEASIGPLILTCEGKRERERKRKYLFKWNDLRSIVFK